MLQSLPTFMEGIAGKSARDDAKLGVELAGHIISLEASLGLDWRAQQSLLLAMPALAQVPIPLRRLLKVPVVRSYLCDPRFGSRGTKKWQQEDQTSCFLTLVCCSFSSQVAWTCLPPTLMSSLAPTSVHTRHLCRCSAATHATMCCCPWRCAGSQLGRQCCARQQRTPLWR